MQQERVMIKTSRIFPTGYLDLVVSSFLKPVKKVACANVVSASKQVTVFFHSILSTSGREHRTFSSFLAPDVVDMIIADKGLLCLCRLFDF